MSQSRLTVWLATAVAVAVFALAVRWIADEPGVGSGQAGNGSSVSSAAVAGATDGNALVGGSGPLIYGGDDQPLQPLDLGNLEATPWHYRDEAAELAARRAAIERARIRTGGPVPERRFTGTLPPDAIPVTASGPESGRPSPAIAALPGPGEVVNGNRRVGPSPPVGGIPHPAPESGGTWRTSAGPAMPETPASTGDGPGVTPIDPEAPGPRD